MATKQPEADIEFQVAGLSANLLACRSIRHAWAEDQPFYKVEVEGGVRGALYVERILICMRCETRRVLFYRVHDHWLEQLSSRYHYPEGYRLHGKADRPLSQVVHFEAFRRAQSMGLPTKV